MKIPSDAIIPREKLTQYLLLPQTHNDKSQFLAQAGFTLDNPDDLEMAIRHLIQENDAILDSQNEFGTFYRVEGALVGLDAILRVVTIWIIRTQEDVFRFVTLKPGKETP